VKKNGSETVLLDLTVAPVRSEDGVVRWLLAEGRDVTGTGGEDGVPIPKVIGFGPSGSWLTRRGKVVINNAKPLIQIRASAVHSRNYPALGLLAQISVLISSCIVLASTSPLRISNRLEIQRLCIIPHRYAIASAAI